MDGLRFLFLDKRECRFVKEITTFCINYFIINREFLKFSHFTLFQCHSAEVITNYGSLFIIMIMINHLITIKSLFKFFVHNSVKYILILTFLFYNFESKLINELWFKNKTKFSIISLKNSALTFHSRKAFS